MTLSWLASSCILWAGLVLGVSFIATPVKFMAPHLSLPIALEIGKVTFYAFNKIEWVMLALTLLAAYFYGPHTIRWWLIAALTALMVIETFWLLPTLYMRADQVIAGIPSSPARTHLLYVAADSLKILVLLGGTLWLSRGTGEL